MDAVPGAIPVTTPVVASTDAAAGLLLLQAPPLRPVLVNVVLEPTHNVTAPLTVPALASGFTVIICVAVEVPQPFVNV